MALKISPNRQIPLALQQRPPIVEHPFAPLFHAIALRLSAKEIGAWRSTCHSWKLAADTHRDLWKILFKQHFPHQYCDDISDYQRAYKNQHRRLQNLTKGVYVQRDLLNYDASIPCVFIHDDLLIARDDNAKKFLFWDLSRMRKQLSCIPDLMQKEIPFEAGDYPSEAHGSSHIVIDNKLYAGLMADDLIKIYDLDTCKNTGSLQGHEGTVSSLIHVEGTLCSGSSDGTIKIWNLSNGDCIRTFKTKKGKSLDEIHKGSPIRSLAYANGKLYSGSSDKTIKVWNYKTGICEKTFIAGGGEVTCLSLTNKTLISSHCDIKIWNLDTLECIGTLEGHGDLVISLIVIDDRILISGDLSDEYRIWDLDAQQCLRVDGIESDEDGWQHSLAFDHQSMALFTCHSGSKHSDSGVNIWNFGAHNYYIFKNIGRNLNRFKDKVHDFDIKIELQMFSKMPQSEKNEIFKELYKILYPHSTNTQIAKDAFYNQNGQYSSPQQKARAILNYLQDDILASGLLLHKIYKNRELTAQRSSMRMQPVFEEPKTAKLQSNPFF